MNPYRQDKSILILDNCAIHKMDALREIVEGSGHVLFFLPPYSSDFNPIEKSFSCCTFLCLNLHIITYVLIVKHWLRKNWHRVQATEYPEITLLESTAMVTAEKLRGWFIHSGYNVE